MNESATLLSISLGEGIAWAGFWLALGFAVGAFFIGCAIQSAEVKVTREDE